jgi:diguanylate cyclase (GGDEF)-like protein
VSAAQWSVRALAPHVLALVVAVELLAVAASVWGLAAEPPQAADLGVAALLAALAVGYNEFALRTGAGAEAGARVANTDLISVWVFCGALVLPAGLAGALAIFVPLAIAQRGPGSGPRSGAGSGAAPGSGRVPVPLHRTLYSTATVVLAAVVAGRLATMLGGRDPAAQLVAIVVAGLVFALVNGLLIAAVIAVSEPEARRAAVFGRGGDNAVELATIALGGLAATAIGINAWLLVFVLPAVLVLERAVALPQLEVDATVDGKTGLLNAAAWHRAATKELRRAAREGTARGVLVVDVDHFKLVNDTYGHLTGDVVLAEVAAAVCGAVRRRDVVGRFGGEEFVVLITPMPDAGSPEQHIAAVAERLRVRVARMRVPVAAPKGVVVIDDVRVSVGVAVLLPPLHPPGDATRRDELRDLLGLADAALYAAKRAGRDCVRIGERSRPPADRRL